MALHRRKSTTSELRVSGCPFCCANILLSRCPRRCILTQVTRYTYGFGDAERENCRKYADRAAVRPTVLKVGRLAVHPAPPLSTRCEQGIPLVTVNCCGIAVMKGEFATYKIESSRVPHGMTSENEMCRGDRHGHGIFPSPTKVLEFLPSLNAQIEFPIRRTVCTLHTTGRTE